MKGFLFFLFIIPFLSKGQSVHLVSTLNFTVSETSGLLNLNGRLITHNDSGGVNELYEIDSTSGMVTRTVVIDSATNVDWEAICADDQFIYIGDFGNNAGTRTDLVIYRVSINDYLTTPNDTVVADKIEFYYNDQTDFSPATFSTNFDAEAFLSFNDSLYIFTKNWGNTYTNIYALSRVPGSQQAIRRDSLAVGGLITGATMSVSGDTLWLCGYTPFNAVLGQVIDFLWGDFSLSTVNFYPLDCPESYQIEGICQMNNQLLLSAELHSSGASALYRQESNTLQNVEVEGESEATIFPNPVQSELTILGDFLQVDLYTFSGEIIGSFFKNPIDLSSFPTGHYFVVVSNKLGKKSIHQLILN